MHYVQNLNSLREITTEDFALLHLGLSSPFLRFLDSLLIRLWTLSH